MTRILSVFNLLKRVGFAVLFLTHSLEALPVSVKTPSKNYFVENLGQWEGDFQFKCEVGSAVYYVTPQGLTVDFREFKRYPKPRERRDPLDVLERHEERDSVTVSGHVVQIHYVVPHQSSGGQGWVKQSDRISCPTIPTTSLVETLRTGEAELDITKEWLCPKSGPA